MLVVAQRKAHIELLSGPVPDTHLQQHLFIHEPDGRLGKLLGVVDALNKRSALRLFITDVQRNRRPAPALTLPFLLLASPE